MKKENRKMAQEKRKLERAKQERQRKLKKFFLYFIPCAALVIIVLILALHAGQSDSSETDTRQESATATGSSIVSTENGTYDSDSSLTVKDGDSLNIDYTGTIDGEEFEGGSTDGSGTVLVVGSHSYIDDFEEQLIGHHPQETVEVNVTFPEDYGVEKLNGKDAVFQVTINGIYQE